MLKDSFKQLFLDDNFLRSVLVGEMFLVDLSLQSQNWNQITYLQLRHSHIHHFCLSLFHTHRHRTHSLAITFAQYYSSHPLHTNVFLSLSLTLTRTQHISTHTHTLCNLGVMSISVWGGSKRGKLASTWRKSVPMFWRDDPMLLLWYFQPPTLSAHLNFCGTTLVEEYKALVDRP